MLLINSTQIFDTIRCVLLSLVHELPPTCRSISLAEKGRPTHLIFKSFDHKSNPCMGFRPPICLFESFCPLNYIGVSVFVHLHANF